jgi:hypothetical protein
MQSHLSLLQHPNYFNEAVFRLVENFLRPSEKIQPSAQERDIAKQTRTLCSRGLFSKTITEEDIVIAPFSVDNKEKLQSLYPTKTLPQTLSTKRAVQVYTPSYAEVCAAIRKSKRGKAPAFSGWTRELLFPLIAQKQSTLVQAALASIFTDIINVEALTTEEARLYKNGVLIPFCYTKKANKLRPITLMEFFVKVTLILLLTPRITEDTGGKKFLAGSSA